MRRYETTVIFSQTSTEDQLKSLMDRLANTIESNGGKIIRREDWGIKQLAYRIAKDNNGRICFLDFISKPTVIREIERQIKIFEGVIRFLTVLSSRELDMKAIEKEIETIAAQKVQEQSTAGATQPAQPPAVETPNTEVK